MEYLHFITPVNDEKSQCGGFLSSLKDTLIDEGGTFGGNESVLNLYEQHHS